MSVDRRGEREARADDPDDYLKRRNLQDVKDALEGAWDVHLAAVDRRLEGTIGQGEAERALYEAVRTAAYKSEPVIKRDPADRQWYWDGWYPTESGDPPIKTRFDGQHGVRVPVVGEDGQPERVAIEPNERLVDRETGDELDPAEHGRPRLVADRDGEPLYPTLTNVIGREPPERQDEAVPIMGLDAFVDINLPLTFEERSKKRHQLKIWEEQREVEQYGMSLDTSLAALRLLGEFWDPRIGLEQSGSLPEQKGINFAEGEKGHVEHGDRR